MKSKISIFLLLMLLVLTAYAPALKAGFNPLDDQFSIIHNERIRDIKNFSRIFYSGFFNDTHYYRPMVEASFFVEYQLFKLNAFYYHFNNVLLHGLNAFLVFILINLIVRNYFTACLTAVLFAIHPMQSESVVKIADRSIMLACFFSLISFIAFIYLRKRKFKLPLYFLSLSSFLCALLSKESAAMLPVVFLGYALFIDHKRGESPLLSRLSVLPYIILLIYLISFRRSLGVADLFHWGNWHDLALAFLSFLRGLIDVLRLYLFPVGLYFDRSQLMFGSFLNFQVLATLIFWLCVSILCWKFRRQLTAETLFFLFWFCVELIPVSQIFTIIQVSPNCLSLAEHFFYVGSIAVYAVLASVIYFIYRKLKENSINQLKIVQLVIGCFLIFLFIITLEQATYAGNIKAMYRRSVSLNPYNARTTFNLGLQLASEKKYEEAEDYFRRAAFLDPGRPRIQIALGKSLCDQGRYLECIDVYNDIAEAGADTALLNENKRLSYKIILTLAHNLEKQGRMKEARIYYEKYLMSGQNDIIDVLRKLQKLN